MQSYVDKWVRQSKRNYWDGLWQIKENMPKVKAFQFNSV